MSTPSEPTKLVVQVPGPDAPGFLKRQRKALLIQRLQMSFKAQAARFRGNGEEVPADVVEQMDAALSQLASFILDYVVEPADRTAAAEAIDELSETKLHAIMESITKGGTPAPAALPKDSGSPTSAPSAPG